MDAEKKQQLASDLAQAVGMQIKLRRKELKMTIEEVAQSTGMTLAAISRIEQGKSDVKMSTLAVLRSALGFEISISKISVPAEGIEAMEYEPEEQ